MKDKTMQHYKIERTGRSPFSFNGECIGCGSTKTVSGSGSNRWTTVDIYKTVGGKFVAAITNHTMWEGEHDYTKAWTAADAQAVIDNLKDESGKFGRASQEALEHAAEASPEFAAAYVETVD